MLLAARTSAGVPLSLLHFLLTLFVFFLFLLLFFRQVGRSSRGKLGVCVRPSKHSQRKFGSSGMKAALSRQMVTALRPRKQVATFRRRVPNWSLLHTFRWILAQQRKRATKTTCSGSPSTATPKVEKHQEREKASLVARNAIGDIVSHQSAHHYLALSLRKRKTWRANFFFRSRCHK